MTHRRRHGFDLRETAQARGKSVAEIAGDFGAWGAVPECIAQNRSKRHRALTDSISRQAFTLAALHNNLLIRLTQDKLASEITDMN